jgi:pimeloyl-ACP methyl ester carboxylesterase
MESFNHRRGDTISIEGAALYYEIVGAPTNAPLLLLHGGLGNLEDFNSLVPHLVDTYRLIAIDSRGHGKSTLGTASLSYARMQADVEAIVAYLGLRSFGVIGFSDGGVVGLRIAAANHPHLTKLVAIGTPYELRDDDPLRRILSGVTADSWRGKFPDNVESYERLNPSPDFAALVQAAVPMWIDTSVEGYPAESVRSIGCELLVARGDDDHLVSRASAFELVERVPKARLLNIPFAGHVLHGEQTAMLMMSVGQFLQQR